MCLIGFKKVSGQSMRMSSALLVLAFCIVGQTAASRAGEYSRMSNSVCCKSRCGHLAQAQRIQPSTPLEFQGRPAAPTPRPSGATVDGFSADDTGVGKACKLPDGSTCYPNKSGTKANCYTPGRMVRGGPWLSDNRCATAGGTWTTDPDGKRYCKNMANPCK